MVQGFTLYMDFLAALLTLTYLGKLIFDLYSPGLGMGEELGAEELSSKEVRSSGMVMVRLDPSKRSLDNQVVRPRGLVSA